ncbi:MAG: hypothetical protein EB829_06930 [Nitrosopumilus sp. H8]|nr:MAG: hypothetical protein EB829_06930 [Nitrosopumilus sp. H8]RNJ77802.1 MAG: hypothetical protein EB830_01330 [Nitrosopumilus sp. H13]
MDKEEKIRQEDCSEDGLGSGILTLTSKRIAFDKTMSRIMDFSKRMGDTMLDIPLQDITRTWKEGRLIKKVCISTGTKDEKIYKFGVFGTGGWAEDIEDAISSLS